MQHSSSFQIYNASAGSGKTFTLVKEYVKVLLQSNDVFYFQKILAITFTNKAAGEMKERVLKSLADFSEGKPNEIIEKVLEETNINIVDARERSKKILHAILVNYSAFSVTTIDSFTHKIIKNFAFDLGLTLNFEVEMDAISLLNEAVDLLMSKIGTQKEITNLLIDFSLSKIDEDKSWDISFELKEFAKVLLNEDDIQHFRNLSDKTIADFNTLKQKLQKQKHEIEKRLKEIGDEGLQIIDSNGIAHKDFYYSLLPKHFIALKSNPLAAKFFDQSKLKERVEEGMFYSKSKSEEIKSVIDGMLPDLLNLYTESEGLYQQVILNQLVLKSIIPLAVLNNINQELTFLKEENNIRLNAEFNQLISDNIKNQPTPYIYERLGQRFMHYFIDEMQDTSVLQWQNLIPLIDNALAQEKSSLLLVGDAKQAIYRWRGGKAEQLIDLSDEAYKIFQVEKEVKQLERNYRSYTEVINFNNNFFQYVANFFGNEQYKQLFIEGNKQLENSKVGGQVTINFLEKNEDKEIEKTKYPQKVYEKILALQDSFELNEIAVLVRKKSEGIAVANYLSEKGIEIISSETLLLKNSKKVNFIVQLLQLLQFSNDEETQFDILYFLYHHLNISTGSHDFFELFVKKNLEEFFKTFHSYGIEFNLNTCYELPFYEKIEYIIRSFKLIESSDAYVQFFLDVVLEQQKKGTSIQDFLEFWSVKKDSLSIVTSEDAEAVNIMTIHKSKGLEFPVVIFPYDLDIYRQVKPKVWFDELPDSYEDFNELLIDYSKTLSYTNNRGATIYEQQRQELELDNFNLLYVALTRAVEQLHVITEKRISKTGENTNYYSGIFISYLKNVQLWEDNVFEYSFGEANRCSKKEITNKPTELQETFISLPWQRHNIVMLSSASKLWDTNQETSIAYGNLVHTILSNIKTKKDVIPTLHFYEMQGEISQEILKDIKRLIFDIVNHDDLKDYYSEEVEVFNEKEMITIDNQIIIPDRLVFDKEKVTIIDYKTGVSKDADKSQVKMYQRDLEDLGFKVDKKILIYINETILVEEIA
ncbi:UvrD-helicase domain-containing protein [Tenacibaculum amylolyticum]|uniref:UvrD-helicase domain-containing protein n=1 Tax=Tenacibaculum amylolyticum TaxID=104269 RepID=UPI003894CFA7